MSLNAPPPNPSDSIDTKGLGQGFSAYLIWGFLPLYFLLLKSVGAVEIVAQRILWSVILLLGILAIRKQLAAWWALARQPKVWRLMLLSATLIVINWLAYVWGVNNGHVVSTSLGYFLNPLVNVILGMTFLGERLSRAQMVAVGLAAAGVAILAIDAASGLWISLTLAISFGFYGLVRKIAPIGALEGLATETLLMLPLVLGYLGWLLSQSAMVFGTDHQVDALLIFGAMLTSVPLLLFASAARRIPYSVLGLLQYVAPTIQFLLGIFVYREPLSQAMVICFALIWIGLAIFSADMILAHRRRRIVPA